MKTIIEYSSFKCNLISYSKKYNDIIMEFYKKFNNYYCFEFGVEDSDLFTICLCDDIDKNLFNNINCDITFQRNPETLDFIGFRGFSVTNLLLVQSNKFIVSFNSSRVLWV